MFGDAHAAGDAVVNEHLRLARVGMQRRGYAADVVAVAHCEQRQHAYRRMLDRMQPAHQIQALAADVLKRVRRNVKPYPDGIVDLRGQVYVLFAKRLFGDVRLAPEPDHACGNAHLAQIRGCAARALSLEQAQDARVREIARLRVERHVGLDGIRRSRLYVKVCDEILLPLMQVYAARMQLQKRG